MGRGGRCRITVSARQTILTLPVTTRMLTRSVMQALSVLLVGISCRKHFEASYVDSVASVRKLINWLWCMRENNDTAGRAYQVIYNIIKAPTVSDRTVWADVEGFLLKDNTMQSPLPHQQQEQQVHPQIDPQMYLTWGAEQQLPQQQAAYPQDDQEYFQMNTT